MLAKREAKRAGNKMKSQPGGNLNGSKEEDDDEKSDDKASDDEEYAKKNIKSMLP